MNPSPFYCYVKVRENLVPINLAVYAQFSHKNGCVHVTIMESLVIVMELTFTERLLYSRQPTQCFTGIISLMRYVLLVSL